MATLKRLITEVHRRSLWQVLAIYLVAAWIGYEVIQALTEGLGLPTWFPALAIVLFIIGLPIVLATAFVQEGGPEVARHDPTLLPLGDEPAAPGARAPAEPESGPGATGSEPAGRGLRRLLTWRNAIAGGLVAFGAWGVVATAWLLLAGAPGTEEAAAGSAADRKMVAVLPFENLGPAEHEYFADGITEEILSRLAAIHALGVISRTSVVQYKDSDKTLREIGAELGVDYVLEGSVRWQTAGQGPSRVRVTPQLIRVEDDTHLWSDRFDAVLADIFRVQSEIAEQVTRALDVTLLEPERRTLRARPTENLEAYDYYLRANDYVNRSLSDRDWAIGLDLYQRAVELDPGFAVAWAKLGYAHLGHYWFHWDHTRERLTMARRAVDRALDLAPDLPEAHLAKGYYHYWGELDHEPALEEFAIVRASRPNDAELLSAIAYVQRRQGDWEPSVRNLEEALRLDPRSNRLAGQLALSYLSLRRYADAERLLDRAHALAPEDFLPYEWKAVLYLAWRGDTARARESLERAYGSPGGAKDPRIVSELVRLDLLERNHEAALDRLAAWSENALDVQAWFIPTAQIKAEIDGREGRDPVARMHFDSARAIVERRLARDPEDARLHSALGIAYAGLGRKEEAIRAGARGVELRPLERDVLLAPPRIEDLARIYMMVGEHDAAVDRLEYLLSIPGQLSRPLLRLDPTWDPLRDHPRFRSLVAED